ncbi:MAG: hypothetical protein U1F83_16905 [Verrucomicrobiota bacterium]
MNSCESDPKCCGRSFSVTVAVVLVCLIFAALVWKMRQYTTPAPLGAERAAERAKALAELRAAEADALNNVGWVDPAKGVVRLPIAEAMKLAERKWQNPAEARTDLIARVEKATALPPKAPEKPSAFE